MIAHDGIRPSNVATKVPPISETLSGFRCIAWYALIASRGVAPAIFARLISEVVERFAHPQLAQEVTDMRQEPVPTSPQALQAYMKRASERWSIVLQAAGLKLEE
jgi:tripartite-type tricarboxylate transporter receptor subunit TctC